jgi:hypothetical protein
MLLIEDVATLLGPTIKPKTVSTYLTESREQVGKGARARRGRYASHPFPVPDGTVGRAPWWRLERADEIRQWAADRPGQGVGGGRPRVTD